MTAGRLDRGAQSTVATSGTVAVTLRLAAGGLTCSINGGSWRHRQAHVPQVDSKFADPNLRVCD